MSEKAHVILRSAREAHGWTRVQLIAELGVSEETLKRWEYGHVKPTPDDVGNIERILGAEKEQLWSRWMEEAWDSYREHHKTASSNGLLEAVVGMKHELQDVLSIRDELERDAMTGTLDDPALRRKAIKECEEAQAAITRFLGYARDSDNRGC